MKAVVGALPARRADAKRSSDGGELRVAAVEEAPLHDWSERTGSDRRQHGQHAGGQRARSQPDQDERGRAGPAKGPPDADRVGRHPARHEQLIDPFRRAPERGGGGPRSASRVVRPGGLRRRATRPTTTWRCRRTRCWGSSAPGGVGRRRAGGADRPDGQVVQAGSGPARERTRSPADGGSITSPTATTPRAIRRRRRATCTMRSSADGQLVAHRRQRQVEAGGQHHHLEPPERVEPASWRGRSTASPRGPCSWPRACRAPRRRGPRRRRCGRGACAARCARGRGCRRRRCRRRWPAGPRAARRARDGAGARRCPRP